MRSSTLVRFWLAALLTMLPVHSAFAQAGTVTGVIRSAETGAPLAAVLVQMTTPTGAPAGSGLTNQSGRYQISNVPGGSYTLIATMTGYETGRSTGVSISAGQVATVNLDLIPRAIDLDPVVVSASRRQERALDAPARVEVVTEAEIAVRPTVTPADHLRAVPGIDIATSGVQSTNVVARGFNNVFSGSLYMLSDHRIAGVPSLRVNLLHFVPTTDEDLERMEVVLGPGAALYGPNTANGVLHMLSRSPLTSQGTSMSISGGEQSLFHGTFRTAHSFGENFGIKLSGQYLQADEWQYVDPVEDAERIKFRDNPFFRTDLINATGITPAEADARIARIGARDYAVRRWGGEARADWRITQDLTAVFSAGTNTSSGIELTGLGAGQAEDWRYNYYQARATWNRLFAQAYLNTSDAGETYLLRNGAPISDQSKLFVSQLQHGVEVLAGRQNFTYGLDFLLTMPETNGTINGVYEDKDETRELGGYLQSETALSPKLDLVLAGRLDTHSALPEAIFSPRAALVFKPSEDQSFRLSFNRAFSTPTSLTQFLDLGSPITSVDAARLGYSLRIQGSGDTGFRFRQADGGYLMRSPFNPAGAANLVPVAAAGQFWPAAAAVVGAQGGLDPRMIQYLQSLNPQGIGLTYTHPAHPGVPPAHLASLDLADIPAIRESTSNTIEAGYKGILGQRVLLAADVWWSRRENLVTPLTVSTPFIHFDEQTTAAYLSDALVPFFQAAGMSEPEARAMAAGTAPELGRGIARVPVGVVSSDDVNANGAQLLVTYLNVDDDLDLYGTDLSLTALLNDSWSVEGTASFVSDDVFQTRQGMRVTLNAPKRKGSLALLYRNPDSPFNAEGRVRYNASYPVDSGVFQATNCIDETLVPGVEDCPGGYALVDLNLGYRLPQFPGASLQLAVQNLLDEGYRSFPGVPTVGRMAMLRLKYDF